MARIQRISELVASLDRKLHTKLLDDASLSVVARGTTRHEPIESRERLTTWCLHSDDVVDRNCGHDPLLFETQLTKRIDLKLHLSQPLPPLCVVRPNCHDHLYPIIVIGSNAGVGRLATPSAIVNATTGSILPVLRRFESFRFPAESVSALALVTAILNTGC
jgi:hypothetical protein